MALNNWHFLIIQLARVTFHNSFLQVDTKMDNFSTGQVGHNVFNQKADKLK
jgi:hypothetical protein